MLGKMKISVGLVGLISFGIFLETSRVSAQEGENVVPAALSSSGSWPWSSSWGSSVSLLIFLSIMKRNLTSYMKNWFLQLRIHIYAIRYTFLPMHTRQKNWYRLLLNMVHGHGYTSPWQRYYSYQRRCNIMTKLLRRCKYVICSFCEKNRVRNKLKWNRGWHWHITLFTDGN